ncbi:hypothetical protein FOQG_17178 [Fusarium oxysporum f. sp. raphani 54005]|uniref:Uncharacterized protein n=1 Tax=Fusarium oxysporum f. sp. raphani 54005 TaxID=1089458 RepID=X0B7J8_FUSOX|nr:hypothetical protein FOQG_17178 [Fusarium oxysporum f. sp. raphani 54005]
MDLWGSDNPLCEHDVGCLQSVVDRHGEVEETRWYCVLKLDRLPRLATAEETCRGDTHRQEISVLVTNSQPAKLSP